MFVAFRTPLSVFGLLTLTSSILFRRARAISFGASLHFGTSPGVYLSHTIITLGTLRQVLGIGDGSVRKVKALENSVQSVLKRTSCLIAVRRK